VKRVWENSLPLRKGTLIIIFYVDRHPLPEMPDDADFDEKRNSPLAVELNRLIFKIIIGFHPVMQDRMNSILSTMYLSLILHDL